jgi:hypothetical protein
MKSEDAIAAEVDAVLAEFAHPTQVEPDEFTIAQYAERSGLGYYAARTTVTRAIRAGKLKSRLVRLDGKRVLAYRLAK